jgi:hypothetical protein
VAASTWAWRCANGGAGLAVIHGWRVDIRERTDSVRPELEDFRRQQRDLYIPASGLGFWQGAIRDPADPMTIRLGGAVNSGARLLIDILYGDYEGGQRTIARFGVGPDDDGIYRAEVMRYCNVDQDDPR